MKNIFRLLFALALALPAFGQTGITDLIVARKVNLQGITAPGAITGNVNDYAPAGFANATTFKLSSTLPVNISGLSGGTPGRLLWVVNAGSFDLTFLPESSLSLAANRFAISSPTVLTPGMAVSFIYDATSSRWLGLSQGKATTAWGQVGGVLSDQEDLNDQTATLERAALTTGVASETDTVLFSAPNTSTLRIAPLAAGVYSDLLVAGSPVATAIKSFPQQDFPLSGLGLVADGTYARWIGYDSTGTVVISTSRFTNDSSVIGLGIIVVKRVAGVTTFIDDGGPRSFLTSPQMAGFSELERATVGAFKSSVTVTFASNNMTLSRAAGNITGISANWEAVSGNKNLLELASSSPASFIEVNPAIASGTTLPAAVTVLTATNYWNGSASVALTGPNNASVKRVLLGVKGGLFIQEGEFQYSTLDTAVASAGVAPFTQLLAQELFTEIGRIAVVKNATNLSDPNQARFFVTGGAGGSGTGGVTTTITGTANQVLANGTSGTPQAGAVTLTLPQSIATTSTPTFQALTLTGPAVTYAAGVSKILNVTTSAAGDVGGTSDVRGMDAEITSTGTANLSTVIGVRGVTFIAGTAGTVATAQGLNGSVRLTGAANVTTGTAVSTSVIVSGAGNITGNLRGLLIGTLTVSGAGDITGASTGIEVQNYGRTSATSVTGIDVLSQTSSGTGNTVAYRGRMVAGANRYNLYMDGTAQNYFAGETLIGSTTDAGAFALQVTGDAIFSGTITKPGGTVPLLTTNTTITSGAGAGAGTLTNAPTAGNPTSWVRINDNGTTRFIPAW